MEKPVQQCSFCVMNDQEPSICFDENGRCNYCKCAETQLLEYAETCTAQVLAEQVAAIKEAGKNKPYDCLIGLSGGLDSAYAAKWGFEQGLRMRGIHIDAGWNTAVSESNIQKLVERYKIDLQIIKINDAEMMDLQRAYFLSGVSNQDIPQDHVFFCALYNAAIEQNITYCIDGWNQQSESILGNGLEYDARDAVNLQDIHNTFGKVPLKEFPLMDETLYYRKIPKGEILKKVRPLMYMDYNIKRACAELEADCGFTYYGGKHLESRFTKLFQTYIQPVKFHSDKRRAHFSSLILSGQMTREEALARLSQPPFVPEDLESDIAFFCERIGITRAEFDRVMNEPPRSHYAFRVNRYNLQPYYRWLRCLSRWFGPRFLPDWFLEYFQKPENPRYAARSRF